MSHTLLLNYYEAKRCQHRIGVKRIKIHMLFIPASAMHCQWDIATLLFFCLSHLDLVNTIETEQLYESSSNLADMLMITRG